MQFEDCGSNIIKFFLDTALTTISGINTLSKIFLYIYQQSQVGKYFYTTKYFLIYLFHDGILKMRAQTEASEKQ